MVGRPVEWGTLLSATKLPNGISAVIRKLSCRGRVLSANFVCQHEHIRYRRPADSRNRARERAFIEPRVHALRVLAPSRTGAITFREISASDVLRGLDRIVVDRLSLLRAEQSRTKERNFMLITE